MKSDDVKNQIRDKYNREAAIYDNYYDKKAAKHFMKRKIETALSFKKLQKDHYLLEIGSATGVFSFELEKLVGNLVCIDLSSQNIRLAKEKQQNSKIHFSVGDVENLDFGDSTFDGVISFSTLRYVPNTRKALLEINRVLKPGGYLIADFPNRNCPWFNFLKKPILGRKHIHDHQFKQNEIRQLLEETGFGGISSKKILFVPKALPTALLPIFKVFEFIGERLPLIKSTAAIIFCRASKL